MTETDEPVSARDQWELRVWMGLSTLAVCAALIGVLLVFGHPDNVLHKGAHDWAWMMCFAVVGGFAFPAVTDLIPWRKGA